MDRARHSIKTNSISQSYKMQAGGQEGERLMPRDAQLINSHLLEHHHSAEPHRVEKSLTSAINVSMHCNASSEASHLRAHLEKSQTNPINQLTKLCSGEPTSIVMKTIKRERGKVVKRVTCKRQVHISFANTQLLSLVCVKLCAQACVQMCTLD